MTDWELSQCCCLVTQVVSCGPLHGSCLSITTARQLGVPSEYSNRLDVTDDNFLRHAPRLINNYGLLDEQTLSCQINHSSQLQSSSLKGNRRMSPSQRESMHDPFTISQKSEKFKKESNDRVIFWRWRTKKADNTRLTAKYKTKEKKWHGAQHG